MRAVAEEPIWSSMAHVIPRLGAKAVLETVVTLFDII
jgi:hypothetical protein